ncbi:MAG: hypothetical protein KDA90_03425 [Planctomycetaceae bacterium]|nr:hypothetical protein [Planctomycetaceae bacterium]
MTIRYECEGCGSVLKIKDELAGTDGKCPKCKRKFVVPEPDDAPKAESKPKAAKAPAAPAPKKAAAADDDFDPADFLMEGNDGPSRPSAGLGTPEPSKPTPGGRKPISAPPGAARIQRPIELPGGSGGTNASANAHDLLTKAAEDSRAKSSTMPGEKQGPKYDFSVIKSQLKQGLPYVGGALVVGLLAYWIMDYMMGDRLPLPPLANVTGTVSYDGKPISGVKVILSPITVEAKSTSGKDIRLRSSVGVTDKDGYFHMEYLPGLAGAPLGKVKVFMEPLTPTPDVMKKIPPKFLQGSAIVEVKEVGNTDTFTFNFSANN